MSEIFRPHPIAVSRVVMDEGEPVLPVAKLRDGAGSGRTGCPFHDVRHMLRDVGLRPTRQRLALVRRASLMAAASCQFFPQPTFSNEKRQQCLSRRAHAGRPFVHAIQGCAHPARVVPVEAGRGVRNAGQRKPARQLAGPLGPRAQSLAGAAASPC